MALKKNFPNLVVMLLTFVSFSCVDIPSTGINVPDTRSLVRYVNLAKGTDTVAFSLSTDTIKTITGKADLTYPVTFKVTTRKDSIYNRDTLVQRNTSVATDTSCHSGTCDTVITTVTKVKRTIVSALKLVNLDTTITKTCRKTTCVSDTVVKKDSTALTPLVKFTIVRCDTALPPNKCVTTTKQTGSVIDTLRRDTVTTRDTLYYRYSVTERDSSTVNVITSKYKRYVVDWDSTLNIIVDGSSVASLSQGQSSSYMSVAAGGRHIYLKTNAMRIDTIHVIKRDSMYVWRYDTTGFSKSSRDTTITTKKYQQFAVASPPMEYITADSTAPTLLFSPDRKVSIFLIRNIVSEFSDFKDNGRANYGWMKYLSGDERYTFASRPSSDSIRVRYVSASLNGGGKHIAFDGKYTVQKPNRVDTLNVNQCPKGFIVCNLDSAVVLLSNFGYYTYPAGTYRARFSLTSSLTVIADSAVFSLSDGGHSFTFTFVDSGSTFRARRLTDD